MNSKRGESWTFTPFFMPLRDINISKWVIYRPSVQKRLLCPSFRYSWKIFYIYSKALIVFFMFCWICAPVLSKANKADPPNPYSKIQQYAKTTYPSSAGSSPFNSRSKWRLFAVFLCFKKQTWSSIKDKYTLWFPRLNNFGRSSSGYTVL